jgi:putative transposase
VRPIRNEVTNKLGASVLGLTCPKFPCHAEVSKVRFPEEKRQRFSDEQIIGFLKQAEAGVAVKELCRTHGFSDASFYKWRGRFGGMEASDARRLKELESENGKLKKLLAEAMLDNEALKVVARGKR